MPTLPDIYVGHAVLQVLIRQALRTTPVGSFLSSILTVLDNDDVHLIEGLEHHTPGTFYDMRFLL